MTIQHGDIAMMIDLREKVHVITIQTGKKFETHHGFILHDTMIGRPWGSTIYSSTGHPYLCIQPSTSDLIRHIKRSSQVIFPKDSAHIMMKMNIKPGVRILESGCGSGGLTMAVATAVMPAGHVYSQEIREDFIALTKRNMARYGLDPYVTFIHGDGAEGFKVDEPVDAVFLDMLQPETCVGTARKVLKDGGWFGSLVPTTNQVQAILLELAKHDYGSSFEWNEVAQQESAAATHFEFEYQWELFTQAAAEVRESAAPSTWQAFWLTAIEGRSISDTAETLGVREGMVYLSRCRIMDRIRKLIQQWEGETTR